jgi:hypothetical protein
VRRTSLDQHLRGRWVGRQDGWIHSCSSVCKPTGQMIWMWGAPASRSTWAGGNGYCTGSVEQYVDSK